MAYVSRIAGLCPGVGAEYTGMGRALFERYPVYRDAFEEGSDILGFDLARLCFSPDEKARLKRQEEAQVAVFATSVAMHRVFESEVGLPFSHFAGHSLGEYSALCCGGAISFAEGLQLVRRRGELIRSAAAPLGGTMMWVLELDVQVVEAVCRARAAAGVPVFASAYDAPRQAAMSGEVDAVLATAKDMEARGAIVYPLRLEGPYHSPMMKSAAEEMAALLEGFDLGTPSVPVLANVDADLHEGGAASAAKLARQLEAPVRWLDVQRRLVAEGVGLAIELGPGNVLSFLLGKTTNAVRAYPMDKLESADALAQAIAVGGDDFDAIVEASLRVAVSTRAQRASDYAGDVVAPYERLEAVRESASAGGGATAEDAAQALAEVEQILDAKGFAGAARERQLNRVLGGKVWRG